MNNTEMEFPLGLNGKNLVYTYMWWLQSHTFMLSFSRYTIIGTRASTQWTSYRDKYKLPPVG